MNNDDSRLDAEMRSRFRELGAIVDRTSSVSRPAWGAGGARSRSRIRKGADLATGSRVRVAGSIGRGAAAVAISVVVVAALIAHISPAPGGVPATTGMATETVGVSGSAAAPRHGGFAATGDMAIPRAGATATLLQDGQVLVVGGRDDTSYLSSAELFDPHTDNFRATGSLPTTVGGQTATLLSDGRVLIAGGFHGESNERTAVALLYDLKTGTFTATGAMLVARSNHSAILLSDGRVLIVGGFGTDYLSSAEVYEPATGTFSQAGSMNASLWNPVATLLPTGDVLVVSSGSPAKPGPASAELFDPKTNTFRPTSSMIAGWASSATVLRDGRVLVTGETATPIGTVPTGLPSAEIYDPNTGMFTLVGSPPAISETPALLADGHVLLLGSLDAKQSACLFDPTTDSFGAGVTMTVTRGAPTVVLLKDRRVLVAGGNGPSAGGDTPGPVLNSAELYTP